MALSDGATKLGAGTLYGLLDRMCDAGLVEASGEEVVDGRLRRYYRLTDERSATATHTRAVCGNTNSASMSARSLLVGRRGRGVARLFMSPSCKAVAGSRSSRASLERPKAFARKPPGTG
jgi:DNA-binding PadR family transcriptional regulator